MTNTIPSIPINLVRTTPPTPPWLGKEMAIALERVIAEEDMSKLMRTHKFMGTEEDKAIGAEWLARRFGVLPGLERLIVTNGTQNAMFITLNYAIGADNTILAEDIGYYGLCKLSKLLGIKVVAVKTDRDGADPEDVERLCRELKPKGLFLAPTLHNPTTRIMSLERRQSLTILARKHGLVIIEDDVYGMLPSNAPPPMSVIAPDITWHVTSPAKCVAPGLRIGYLVTPGAKETAAVFKPVDTTSTWFVSPISAVMMKQLVRNGAVDRIFKAIHEEAVERQKLASNIFNGADIQTHPEALFLWMNLPSDLSNYDFVKTAQERGVIIRPGQVFSIDQQFDPRATRIVLGAPSSRNELAVALNHIADIIGINA